MNRQLYFATTFILLGFVAFLGTRQGVDAQELVSLDAIGNALQMNAHLLPNHEQLVLQGRPSSACMVVQPAIRWPALQDRGQYRICRNVVPSIVERGTEDRLLTRPAWTILRTQWSSTGMPFGTIVWTIDPPTATGQAIEHLLREVLQSSIGLNGEPLPLAFTWQESWGCATDACRVWWDARILPGLPLAVQRVSCPEAEPEWDLVTLCERG